MTAIIPGTAAEHEGLWLGSIQPQPKHRPGDRPDLAARLWKRRAANHNGTLDQLKASDTWSCREDEISFWKAVRDELFGEQEQAPAVSEGAAAPVPDPRSDPVNFDNIPIEMKRATRWVMWKREPRTDRDGKPYQTKVPYQVNGSRAKSSDSKTWNTFDAVVACIQDNPGKYAGIGFNAGDDSDTGKRWIGADVDKMFDPDAGEWKDPEALDLLMGLGSYAEISPSGTGGRAFAWGYLQGDRRKNGAFECYDGFNQKGEPGGRFLTVTGRRIEGAPTEIRDAAPAGLAAFERKLAGDETPKIQKPKVDLSVVSDAAISEDVLPLRPEDDQIIEMIRRSKQGAKFALLFDDPGGWKKASDADGNPFKSPSEARYSLISILYWWTRDLISTHAVMSRSAIVSIDPDKWQRLGAGEVAQIAGAMHESGMDADPPWAGAYGWSEEGLPRIATNAGDTPVRTRAALEAMQAKNDPPSLFVRSGALVEVTTNETGGSVIRPVELHRIRSILSRCAKWIRFGKNGTYPDVVAPDTPPDILARDHTEWHVPPLVGVTACPIIRQDGTIPGPGYDAESRMYYAPVPGFTMPDIPETPTQNDVAAAMALIEEVFHDFPFADEKTDPKPEKKTDRANTYGALFTACLRPLIGDIVPLFLCDKPVRGTGASKLQDVISTIATGTVTSPTAMPKSDEELEKKIFSILRGGSSLVILDNLSETLRSDDLASVLTSRSYKGRILGRTEEATYQNNVFWMANGNNVLIGGDLARRIWVTRLDPQNPTPWRRTDFIHPDLIQWCTRERGRILAAILTITRSWIQAGKKDDPTVPNVGSFERWRSVIAGILCHAGVKGFYANADTVVEQADVEQNEWEAFLIEMYALFPSTEWTTKDLHTRLRNEHAVTVSPEGFTAEEKDDLRRRRITDALPGQLAGAWYNPRKSFTNAAGRHLSQIVDRQYNTDHETDHVLRKAPGTHKRAQLWKIDKIDHDPQSKISEREAE